MIFSYSSPTCPVSSVGFIGPLQVVGVRPLMNMEVRGVATVTTKSYDTTIYHQEFRS